MNMIRRLLFLVLGLGVASDGSAQTVSPGTSSEIASVIVIQSYRDGIRPNPYFQPPDARTGGRIDVSDVQWIAFAPQDVSSGRLAIGKIMVTQ
jgi:hypothetical protein